MECLIRLDVYSLDWSNVSFSIIFNGRSFFFCVRALWLVFLGIIDVIQNNIPLILCAKQEIECLGLLCWSGEAEERIHAGVLDSDEESFTFLGDLTVYTALTWPILVELVDYFGSGGSVAFLFVCMHFDIT